MCELNFYSLLTQPDIICVKFIWESIVNRIINQYERHNIYIYIETQYNLTDWGRVTHICVSKLTTIGWDNGLAPGRRQAIIWTNAWILLIWPLETNLSESLIEIYTFSFKENAFENVRELAVILSRPQGVNPSPSGRNRICIYSYVYRWASVYSIHAVHLGYKLYQEYHFMESKLFVSVSEVGYRFTYWRYFGEDTRKS